MTTLPYEVIADGQDTDAWLEARRTLVTASDVAAVMGLSPYTSALEVWVRKTGRDTDDRAEESEAVAWGRKLEPLILDEFSVRAKVAVEPNRALLRSRTYPWLGCTVDGWTAAGEPIEAKTAGYFAAQDWSEGVPAYYAPQVQTACIVTGTARGWIAALLAGQRLVWGDVAADAEARGFILSTTEAFAACLRDDTPPAPDGSESAARALFKLYPRVRPDEAACVLGGDHIDAVARLDAVEEELKALEAEREVIRQSVCAAIGAAERGILPAGGGFTWRGQVRKPKVLTCECGRAHEVTKGSEFRVLRRVAG